MDHPQIRGNLLGRSADDPVLERDLQRFAERTEVVENFLSGRILDPDIDVVDAPRHVPVNGPKQGHTPHAQSEDFRPGRRDSGLDFRASEDRGS